METRPSLQCTKKPTGKLGGDQSVFQKREQSDFNKKETPGRLLFTKGRPFV